ncbi:hypothetical protein [Nocardia sp. X0981]
MSADRFGSLDPGVLRAGAGRGRPEHPAPSSRPESAAAGSDAEPEDDDPPSSGSAAPEPAEDRFPRPAAEETSATPVSGESAPSRPRLAPARSPDEPRWPAAPAVPAAEPRKPRQAYDSGSVAHTAGHSAPWSAESAELHEYLPHAETAGALPIGGQALIGLCLGLAVLLAVSCFYLTPSADEPAPATLVTAVSTRTVTEETPPEKRSPDIGAGFVFGKVKTNDGSTLHVTSELTKSEIVVHTDAETKVYVLIATEVAAIAVGAPVMVYGRKHADGTISADTITGVSLRAIGSN